MNATSSWEKQARALEDAVAARPAPEAALPEYLRVLDTVRRETMAAQPDDYLRQEAGILFEQARQAGQLMTAVAAPKEEARPARKEKQLLSLVGMVAGFLACAAAPARRRVGDRGARACRGARAVSARALRKAWGAKARADPRRGAAGAARRRGRTDDAPHRRLSG